MDYYISFVPGFTLDSDDAGKPSKPVNKVAGNTHLSRKSAGHNGLWI